MATFKTDHIDTRTPALRIVARGTALAAFALVALAMLALVLAGCTSGELQRRDTLAAAQAEAAQVRATSEAQLSATVQQQIGAGLAELRGVADAARSTLEQAAKDAQARAQAASQRGDAERAAVETEASRKASEAAQAVHGATVRWVVEDTAPGAEPGTIDVPGTLGGIAATVLPPPFGALAALGLGIWGVLERRKARTNEEAARTIAYAVDAARMQSANVRAALENPTARAALEAELAKSDAARKIYTESTLAPLVHALPPVPLVVASTPPSGSQT